MKAKDFCLLDHNEKKICLKDFRGKWVIVYFYPRDNTPGCTREAIGFSENLSKFRKLNCSIIGISKDSCQSHARFIGKHDLTVTLLSDPEKEVIKKYNAWKEKKLYGKVSMGIVRSTFLIDPDGEIVQSWEKVKVNGHVDEVLEELRVKSKE